MYIISVECLYDGVCLFNDLLKYILLNYLNYM